MNERTTQDHLRLREYRRRADSKRRIDQVQARLPPELLKQFRDYMRTTGLNQNQAIIAILSTFFN